MVRFLYILPVAFFGSLGSTLYTLGCVFLLQERFHLDGAGVGQFAAEWALAYLFGCLALSRFLVKLRVTSALLLATASLGLLWAALGRVDALWTAHLINLGCGLVTALFWPPIMGWVSAGLEGPKLGRGLSWYNLSWSAGTVAGPFLAGLLSTRGVAWPLWMSTGLGFACVAILALARSKSIDRSAPAPGPTPGDASAPEQNAFMRYLCWIGLFATHVLVGVILNVFPVWAQRDLGYSKVLIGTMLLFRALVTATTFFLSGRFSFWHQKAWPIFALEGLLVATLAALALGPSFPGLFAGLLLVGFTLAASYVESIFHGVQGSKNRSRRMAIHESLLTAGIVVGAQVGGFLLDHRGMAWVWGGSALLISLAMAVQALWGGSSKKNRAHGPKPPRLLPPEPGGSQPIASPPCSPVRMR
ncbi:MAG: MFS transporter [Spirochaetes bacterium]|nr:MFS transporter [Spirochaetota bacterium]